MFSAYGGIGNYEKPQVLIAYLWHLGKGWIVRGITTRRLPYWANELSTQSWNKLYRLPLLLTAKH